MIRYYDITGHEINAGFIVYGDKSKPRLDLTFQVYGDVIRVEGAEDCIDEWNLRFDFRSIPESAAENKIEKYLEECSEADALTE